MSQEWMQTHIFCQVSNLFPITTARDLIFLWLFCLVCLSKIKTITMSNVFIYFFSDLEMRSVNYYSDSEWKNETQYI